MEDNYSSKYSGEQVDAAVEYFLRHSQTEEGSYEYDVTVFCESSHSPSQPFNNSSLPTDMPANFPFSGSGGELWYDVPNSSSKNWYQCVLKVNSKSKKVVSQGSPIPLSGNSGSDGTNGTNGNDGNDGNDGADGKNGNYTEFRYKRSSSYALTLSPTQKQQRRPTGWALDWDEADVETYSSLKVNMEGQFDYYLCTFSSGATSASSTEYFSLGSNPSYSQILSKFNSYHAGVVLSPTEEQQALIVSCYKAFYAVYVRCSSPSATETPLACNTSYHKVWTDYIDENHFWVLFQISAVINGEDESLVQEWSDPQRIQGVDGKPGPKGSNGIAGVPGVNIAIAFTLGTENSVRPDAADPTASPYNTNYLALFNSGTRWSKESPEVTTAYPYIWFTQCRYLVTKNAAGQDVYTFEDRWSTPKRYTGLNGVTTQETVYVRNPIIYPAGIFALNTTYANDGNRAPYVYYNGNYYYLSGQGTFTSDRSTNNPATATAYWTLMEHFEALFAQVGIIANGLVGSMVFNEEYVFSQQGVDQNGNTSTHYEYFRHHYSTNALLTDPYDANAAFKPNFCLDCKTGRAWSVSRDTAIANASSEIIQTATNISMQVKEEINGELATAGINITAEGVKVTGQFEGTMGGTFNGKVSAHSLEVVDDGGIPVILFDTYKSAMGTPSGGTAPDEGTPVLLINYKGSQYLLSMVKLVTGSSSGTYRQNAMTTQDLYTTSSISARTGTQGYANYKKITKAPSLTLLNFDGTATSNTVTAKLYASDGTTEVSWSNYLNKYYSGTLVSEYPDKTDLGAGIWAFKVTGSFANVSTDLYNGTPTMKTIALYLGSYPNVGHIFIQANASVYNKIRLINGVISGTSDNIATIAYTSYSSNGTQSSSSAYRFLYNSGGTISAKCVAGTSVYGEVVTSTYFLQQTTSSQTISSLVLNHSHAIVGPKPNIDPYA